MATFNTPHQPAIPMPVADMQSILNCVLALKGAVEQQLGTRMNMPTNRVFVQDTEPSGMSIGDAWVSLQPTASLSFWGGFPDHGGKGWQLFAVAHSDGTLHTS